MRISDVTPLSLCLCVCAMGATAGPDAEVVVGTSEIIAMLGSDPVLPPC